MTPYYSDAAVTLYQGDALDVLRDLPDASVDAVVTDPPYELGFMGREWDRSGVAFRVDLWSEVLRVVKPGAHLLAFGGSRTYHRMACAIEDAGWEIRDQLQWLYGSGFPKSHDVSKAIDKAAGAEREVWGERRPENRVAYGAGAGAVRCTKCGKSRNGTSCKCDLPDAITPEAQRWSGWGTALKPAHEPVVLARKPFNGPVAANVLEHGTGALNIDASRIPTDENLSGGAYAQNGTPRDDGWGMQRGQAGEYQQPTGRWPANVILDEDAAAMLDAQSGVTKPGGTNKGTQHSGRHGGLADLGPHLKEGTASERGYTDHGGASRFFYCAKASTEERNACLPHGTRNTHPTVKPLALMRWLCRLITPPGGVVLDPFIGSGTTAIATQAEGFRAIGIDLNSEYLDLAIKRTAQKSLWFQNGATP